MAMTLTDTLRLSNDSRFQQLLQAAIAQAAIAITNESVTITDHSNRSAFANAILTQLQTKTSEMALGIVAGQMSNWSASFDPATQAWSNFPSDTAITTAVSAVWDSFSG